MDVLSDRALPLETKTLVPMIGDTKFEQAMADRNYTNGGENNA